MKVELFILILFFSIIIFFTIIIFLNKFCGNYNVDIKNEKIESFNVDKNSIVVHTNCCICLIMIKSNDNIVKLDCNHLYHKDCFMKWFKNNNNCPLCRKEIN